MVVNVLLCKDWFWASVYVFYLRNSCVMGFHVRGMYMYKYTKFEYF